MSSSFEREFSRLLEKQVDEASGQRKEMLKKDISGTKKMLEVAVWPVRKSLEGVVLEHELLSRSGAKVYLDAYDTTAGLALESEGFVVHAETITRDRFDFEKSRVRTIAAYGYFYIPFTRDQLDKKPEECQSSFSELMGRHSFWQTDVFKELNVFQREVLRFGKSQQRPIRSSDVQYCLDCGADFARKVLQSLVNKNWIIPSGEGIHRIRQYTLEEKALRLPL